MATFVKKKGPREPKWVVGVDESGTGAYAGPFTVCAYMTRFEDTGLVASEGARDSKKLTHEQRLRIADKLAACAKIGEIVIVPHTYTDQRKVWREAIAKAVAYCLSVVPHVQEVSVEIDGAADDILAGYFQRTWGTSPYFVKGGDALIPQISAASIYAKIKRTELMAAAHERFPMYGWCNESGHGNDGYGTPEHIAAIAKHGICELHRRIRPLIPYFEGKHGADQESASIPV